MTGIAQRRTSVRIGGASWNRTSDLSMIREVRQISHCPTVAGSVSFLLLTKPVRFRRGDAPRLDGTF